jgi:hypothetical protein
MDAQTTPQMNLDRNITEAEQQAALDFVKRKYMPVALEIVDEIIEDMKHELETRPDRKIAVYNTKFFNVDYEAVPTIMCLVGHILYHRHILFDYNSKFYPIGKKVKGRPKSLAMYNVEVECIGCDSTTPTDPS